MSITEGKKKIEWVEESGVKIGADLKLPGTTDYVSTADFDLYVDKLGWAKCAETGNTGTRTPGAASITPNKITSKSGVK